MNDLKVEDLMTPNPVAVPVDMAITRVRSILREEDFRCVPVVNGEHLEGLITRGDVLHISATKSNIEARGMMEKPDVILLPEMDVYKAADLLIKAKEIQAPVVESTDNMKLVGILSVYDILAGFIERKIPPKREKVGEVLTEKVVVCDIKDPLSKVWNKMDESGYSGLPVMKEGKLIGIITRKDLIRYGHARIVKESGDVKAMPVEKIMQTPPIVATKDMPIDEAATIMVTRDVGRLPVVKDPIYVKSDPQRAKEGKLVGIVSREDILKAYIYS